MKTWTTNEIKEFVSDILKHPEDHTIGNVLATDIIAQLQAENARLRKVLEHLAANELSDENCASVELAGKRVRNIARAALEGKE